MSRRPCCYQGWLVTMLFVLHAVRVGDVELTRTGSKASQASRSLHHVRLLSHRQHQRSVPRMRYCGNDESTGDFVRRRLFSLAAALSLLLCVGVFVLWVRGHCFGEVFGLTQSEWTGRESNLTDLSLTSGRGGIWLYFERSHY